MRQFFEDFFFLFSLCLKKAEASSTPNESFTKVGECRRWISSVSNFEEFFLVFLCTDVPCLNGTELEGIFPSTRYGSSSDRISTAQLGIQLLKQELTILAEQLKFYANHEQNARLGVTQGNKNAPSFSTSYPGFWR